MNKPDFLRWFNRGFWKAFSGSRFPIEIPKTSADKAALISAVYEDIASARYAPGIPATELVMNKGHGVARTVPVFGIRDYCVYYFCIKELEDVLCGNRTPNTFGGWTLGGQLRVQENDEIEGDVTDYGRYSFNPQAWTHAFGEFNALLFAQLDPGHYAHVLRPGGGILGVPLACHHLETVRRPVGPRRLLRLAVFARVGAVGQ